MLRNTTNNCVKQTVDYAPKCSNYPVKAQCFGIIPVGPPQPSTTKPLEQGPVLGSILLM